MERVLKVVIQKEDDGKFIREILRVQLGISRKLLVLIKAREQGILLNGERVFVSAVVKEGDELSLLIEENASSSEIIPKAGELSVVYEDKDILVVNKAANIPSHPSKGHIDDTLANIVVDYYQKKGQDFTYRCVNRLDKGTSGLMVIAKNAYSHECLKNQLLEGKLKRQYIAVACGQIPNDEGVINGPIRRKPNEATILREVHPEGDTAETHYSVVKRTPKYTLLRLVLKTGRTHQIRVHLSHLGFPLVGDFLYGKEDKELIVRHALHSERLSLFQPVTGEKLDFCVAMPQDMEKLIEN